MKNIKTLVTVALILAAAITKGQSAKTLAPAEFETKLSATKDKIILDVRTPEEFKENHLAGATTINFYDKDFQNQLGKLNKAKPVFVYCAGGVRSGKASKLMESLGFTSIYNLDGGIKAWKASGKPVVK
jgi:rhodanese-related sulfurtransferase